MSAVGFLLAGAASAETIVQGSVANVRWAPAGGPVSGYQVFVSRNGGAMLDAGIVTTPEVTLPGVKGEVIQIAVRAWGYPNGQQAPYEWGPVSAASDPIRFAWNSLDAYPALDCPSCGRFEVRDTNGDVIGSFDHPSGGTWELVTLAPFAPGHMQALLRERTTGALWIGDATGTELLPYASQVPAGFAQAQLRTADLDGDGATEIVLHDESTGRVEIWGVRNGALVRRYQWSGPIGWHLIGAGDFDGDGEGDLWFYSSQQVMFVASLSSLTYVQGTVFAVPAPATAVAMDVADYDGDRYADVLWRDAAGAMQISLLRGTADAPRLVMQALATYSGDGTVVPRASVDLDGDGVAEILLQDLVTGSTSVAWPLDAVPGRRQVLLPQADPLWKLVGVD